jgi:RNA polymerase-binding transcription factor DksA
MKDSMRERLDHAPARFEWGAYGRCVECHRGIADRCLRLHALPPAMRCQACEHEREQLQGRSQRRALRRDGLSPFSDLVCS